MTAHQAYRLIKFLSSAFFTRMLLIFFKCANFNVSVICFHSSTVHGHVSDWFTKFANTDWPISLTSFALPYNQTFSHFVDRRYICATWVTSERAPNIDIVIIINFIWAVNGVLGE
jgi:hypothetical protein